LHMAPSVWARFAVAPSSAGSTGGGLALADEAVAPARARRDDRAIAVALAARCDALAGPDHVTERMGVASEIVALARRVDDDALELLGRRMRVVALLELRDEAAFDAEVLAYERVATQLGDPLYSWYV